MTPSARIDLLGMPFDVVTFDQTLERLMALSRGARPAYVVTANVDHVVRFVREPSVRPLYRQADLVVADGTPVIWASRFLSTPLPHRVAGSDLTPALCQRAAEEGRSMFFLGGAPGAANAAAEVLRRRHPKLNIVGTFCPDYGFEKDERKLAETVRVVREAKPDILLVGLGSPKQENWIAANKDACGAKLSIGVGVTFSFIAGHVKRAPRWMQRLGLEWLHRLMQEPGRLWRRYLIEDTAFLGMVLKCYLFGTPSARKP